MRSYDAGIDLERTYRWGAGDEGEMEGLGNFSWQRRKVPTVIVTGRRAVSLSGEF